MLPLPLQASPALPTQLTRLHQQRDAGQGHDVWRVSKAQVHVEVGGLKRAGHRIEGRRLNSENMIYRGVHPSGRLPAGCRSISKGSVMVGGWQFVCHTSVPVSQCLCPQPPPLPRPLTCLSDAGMPRQQASVHAWNRPFFPSHLQAPSHLHERYRHAAQARQRLNQGLDGDAGERLELMPGGLHGRAGV